MYLNFVLYLKRWFQSLIKNPQNFKVEEFKTKLVSHSKNSARFNFI